MDQEASTEPTALDEKLAFIFKNDLSVFSLLIRTAYAAPTILFIAVVPFYGLAAIGALGSEYFPEAIQLPTWESNIPVLVRLLYLVGPLFAVASFGIYRFVAVLETTMVLRSITRKSATMETTQLINETHALLDRCIQLLGKDSNWCPGDPTYDAYVQTNMDLEEKKQQILGYLPVTKLSLLITVVLNWYAISLQGYYGIQWGFATKWLAIPLLVAWALFTGIMTVKLVRGR